jgi:hypothetical protein
VTVEGDRERREVSGAGATARVGVAVADDLARQDAGLDRVDDVLLAGVGPGPVVGHVHEALAERGQLGALLAVHALLQLGEHRAHVFEERRVLQDVEHAAHGEQAEPLALGDQDGRGGALVDQGRDRGAVAARDLGVVVGVL